MRSRRAAIILTIFLALLSLILYVTYRGGLMILSNPFSMTGALGSSVLGRIMFEYLLFFLVLIVSFVAPGIAAGAIVGERERQTLHLLQVTLLSPGSIVLGKLGASISYVGLLVAASAPLFAVPLFLGGVTPFQVVRGFVVLGALMVALASVGIYVSSIARRTQFATVAAYALAFGIVIGTLLLFAAEMVWRSRPPANSVERSITLYLSPLAAVSDAVVDVSTLDMVPSPISALAVAVDELTGNGSPLFMGGGVGQPPDVAGRREPVISLWMVNLALLLCLSALCLWRSKRRLRAPADRFLEPRRLRART